MFFWIRTAAEVANEIFSGTKPARSRLSRDSFLKNLLASRSLIVSCSMSKQIHILISGFVQGIGYRSFVRNQARKLGLVGWVRNLPDGRVEAVFEGKEENIKEMVKLCREGPPMTQVKNINTKWDEAIGEFSSFEVVL